MYITGSNLDPGIGSDRLLRWSPRGGDKLAGSGPNPKRERVLQWHWPCGDDVEVCGGDFKFPSHKLHHITRLPPQILGGSRHMYRHPQGQNASEDSGL